MFWNWREYADPFLWYACTKISNTRQNGNDGKDRIVDNKSLTVSTGKQTNVFIKMKNWYIGHDGQN